MHSTIERKKWWVESRRALLCWALLGSILVVVVVNSITGFGATLSKIIHENAMVDKVAHLVFFGVLSFLIHRGLRLHLTCSTWAVILLGSFIAFGLGFLEEFSQLWIRGRTFDYSDLWVNFVGAGLIGPFGCLIIEDRQTARFAKDVDDFSLEPTKPGRKVRRSAFLSSSDESSSVRKQWEPQRHRRRRGKVGVNSIE